MNINCLFFLILISANLYTYTCHAELSSENEDLQLEKVLNNEIRCPKNFNISIKEKVVYLKGSFGCVASYIKIPTNSRYGKHIPSVLVIPTFFTPSSYNNILDHGNPDVNSVGILEASLILPSRCVALAGKTICSDGLKDQGGKMSQESVSLVIQYLQGKIKDGSHNYITELISNIDTSNVGIFAFSHPGMLAMTTLANHAKELSGLSYIVMRENPTQAAFASVEFGDVSFHGTECNPNYDFHSDYSSSFINLNYKNINWDVKLSRPYFDNDGDGKYTKDDFLLGERIPALMRKLPLGDVNLYSSNLIKELSKKTVLSSTIANYEETVNFWNGRVTLGKNFSGKPFNAYTEIAKSFTNIRQMIIFSGPQHVQNCPDAPTAHQAFDGFNSNRLWTRINPDNVYIEYVYNVLYGSSIDYDSRYFPDNDSNWQPLNWEQAGLHISYKDKARDHGKVVPLAGVLEMADRTYFNRWTNLDNNLNKIMKP